MIVFICDKLFVDEVMELVELNPPSGALVGFR